MHLDKEYKYCKEIRENNSIDLGDACKYGHETIIKYLVEHGAHIKGNESVLRWACYYRY